MLKVVHPAPAGQGEGTPKRPRRTSALQLTDAERMRLRAALKNLKALLGGWDVLASVMNVPRTTIEKVVYTDRGGSHAMARCAAQAAGVTVERLLGGLAAADRCPTCGRCG